ncbi:50S ribosomal protein L13 [endosymbiont GvMRE of Glomus versiforme]|uniref:50S ribosomal protein L13 n=1 Tax=endosymbiont GvMRE of Glomus versiforme TaxID=2039283 RepID=UPI000ED89AFA|nr:50S ribosomal protein L13 [endosymbiont GvMRE of Glomus versiforme]RHZ37586.1 50S ribosomal protein L13 [endosymbiont GvMRE of Glomus versiforme]
MSSQERTEIISQKTTIPQASQEEKWHFIDVNEVENKAPGRIAVEISLYLQGKKEVNCFPNFDHEIYVVLVNASKVEFTGKKLNDKLYYRHSGYPGGLKETSAKIMLEKNPIKLMESIVKGMLPPNKLRKRRMNRLFIFPDKEHNLQAREKNFIKINISSRRKKLLNNE